MGKLEGLLNKGAKKTEETKSKQKKDEMPVLALPATPENIQAVKNWRDGKEKEKTGEALRKQQEEVLKPLSLSAYENHCRKEGKFHDSVKVQVGTETPMTFVTQHKYSAITLEAGEKLEKLFGGMFEKCFKQNTEIKLSEKGMKEVDSILEKIVKAVGGEEKFLEFFAITKTYEVTEFAHDSRFVEPELGKLYDAAKEQQLIKPTSPFFR